MGCVIYTVLLVLQYCRHQNALVRHFQVFWGENQEGGKNGRLSVAFYHTNRTFTAKPQTGALIMNRKKGMQESLLTRDFFVFGIAMLMLGTCSNSKVEI